MLKGKSDYVTLITRSTIAFEKAQRSLLLIQHPEMENFLEQRWIFCSNPQNSIKMCTLLRLCFESTRFIKASRGA